MDGNYQFKIEAHRWLGQSEAYIHSISTLTGTRKEKKKSLSYRYYLYINVSLSHLPPIKSEKALPSAQLNKKDFYFGGKMHRYLKTLD